MIWYVYILECGDDRLYTGVTSDLKRRMNEHKKGKGGRFTRAFGVKRLIYKEEHPTKQEALKREAQIKGWTRKQKLALMGVG